MRNIKILNNIDNISIIGDNQNKNSLQKNLRNVVVGTNCTTIGPSCFINCENLESVTLPKNCKYIGDYAFHGCKNLKYINLLDKNDTYPIYYLGNHCFDGCNSLSSLYFNITNPVSRDATIGEYCFANCTNLEQFTWCGWSYMGSNMFNGCTKLTSLNISNNTNYIQSEALAGIPNIKEITIPNKIWLLNDGMFKNCKNLENIIIQDTDKNKSVLLQIGNNVFDGCEKLTSIVIPDSISSVESFNTRMLEGSSIERIICKNIDDSKFTNYEQKTTKIDTSTYITTKSEFIEISANAEKNNIPMIIFTNHYGLNNTTQDGCSMCVEIVKKLNSKEWKKYMQENIDKYYFVYVEYNNPLCNHIITQYKLSLNKTTYYANFVVHIPRTKDTGKSFIYKERGFKKRTTTELIQIIENATAKADIGKISEEQVITNPLISKLGSQLEQITYVSKQGHQYVATENTNIDYSPEIRSNRETYDNFKYGTWYYNAKELREYADKKGIPVLCEYSKDGCTPCMYFKKNVYLNDTFQKWVSEQPYLFCRIELEKNENFENQKLYPEAYYVDKIWAKEKYGNQNLYIPIFFWYWKVPGEQTSKVFDLSSYHFNPSATGQSKPPFSMDELMSMTNEKFNGYSRESEYDIIKTYDLYSNQNKIIGKYAENINNDYSGSMFPCSSKSSISKYEKTIDISGYNTIQSISIGQTVSFKPGIYYIYDTSMGYSYYIDAYGIIFRIDQDDGKNKVTSLLETKNNYDTNITEQKFKCNQWYEFDDTTGILANLKTYKYNSNTRQMEDCTRTNLNGSSDTELYIKINDYELNKIISGGCIEFEYMINFGLQSDKRYIFRIWNNSNKSYRPSNLKYKTYNVTINDKLIEIGISKKIATLDNNYVYGNWESYNFDNLTQWFNIGYFYTCTVNDYVLKETNYSISTFDDIIKESETLDYKVVIFKVSNNTESQNFINNVKQNVDFQKFMSTCSNTYFIYIRGN